jgi:uncharacterized membrane protein
LRGGLAVAALAGVCLCAYLLTVRLAGEVVACPIGGGCAAVQESDYAEVAGVPLPWLGLAADLLLLASALAPGDLARLLGVPVAVSGVLVSVWLTYVEVGILGAICAWCVTSACLMAVSLAIVAVRARRLMQARPGAGERA